jgi:hypothetical protein
VIPSNEGGVYMSPLKIKEKWVPISDRALLGFGVLGCSPPGESSINLLKPSCNFTYDQV